MTQRVIVVTGARGGIGTAIANAFGAQGDSECACVPSVLKVTITFGRHARQLLDCLHTTPIVERSAAV